MKAIAAPFLLLAAGFLTSCENPADQATDAEVAAPREKTVAETEGGARYVFTANSTIGFVGSKVTGSHEGGFKDFTGHFTIEDGEPVGNDHKVEIDLRSLWADNPKLEQHLKGPDFFDIARYPAAVFDITGIEKTERSYSITGNLDLHGVTKSVTFPALVSEDGEVAKIKAEFVINRFDWEIEYAGPTDNLIRKEVVIKLDLEARPE